MTTAEALDQLSAEIPDRTFTADKNAQHHEKFGRSVSYRIAVLPGFDGRECQLFKSPDGFEKPVADCLALAKSVAATTNEE